MDASDDTELERFIATRMLHHPGEMRRERIARVTLELRGGSEAGRVVLFTGDSVEGGRSPANDLVLRDSAVSQCHFDLIFGKDMLRLRDLQSTNGTWVGPVRISEVLLPPYAVFTVGNTDIEIASIERMPVPMSLKDEFGGARGNSPAIRELFALLRRLAATNLDILLHGEPGSGKLLLAEAIHTRSGRALEPMIVHDCAYDKPAGLTKLLRWVSAPPRADRPIGTLVLRHIEHLPTSLQRRLVKFLSARSADGENSRPHKARLLFLADHALRTLASEGLFSDELYRCMSRASVRVPPLRERTGDALYLLEHFLVDLSPDHRLEFRPDAVRALALHPFLDNVTELRSIALRIVGCGIRDRVTRRDLQLGMSHRSAFVETPPRGGYKEVRDQFTRRYFTLLAKEHDGDIIAIAAEAGVSTSTVRRVLLDYE